MKSRKVQVRLSGGLAVFVGAAALAQTAPVNDPCFRDQHNLHEWGPYNPATFESPAGTGAYLAWGRLSIAPGNGRVIGIIDQVARHILNDLPVPLEAYDYPDYSGTPPAPSMAEVHGTHIYGLLAAIADNNFAMAGLAYGAQFVLALQSPPTTLSPMPPQHEYLIDRFEVLDADGVDVISNSWLLQSETVADFADIRDQLEAMASVGGTLSGRGGKGLPFVIAAGNHGLPVGRAAPVALAAGVPGMITVANVAPQGYRWHASNYGPWIDVAAPGEMVISLDPVFGMEMCPPDQLIPECPGFPAIFEELYDERMHTPCGPVAHSMGTSIAAPNVAGAVAMISHAMADEEGPDFERPQIQRILWHTAQKINVPSFDVPPVSRLQYSPLRGFNDGYGFGLLDIDAAVSAVVALAGSGFSWPSSPLSLTATQQAYGDDVELAWTNASPPAQGYMNGEYDEVLVVRYVGNVWDQQVWPRAPGNEILPRPIDGLEYEVDDDLDEQLPVGHAQVVAMGDINVFFDIETDIDTAVTYAIYTINENDFYSIPTVILKKSRKRTLIQHEDNSLSVNGDVDDDFAPAAVIQSLVDFEITGDAAPHCGSSDNECWHLATPSNNDVASLSMQFDLTRMVSAALTFDEIVEVFGFALTSGEVGGQWCDLRVQVIDEWDDPVGEAVDLLVDHTSIPFDDASWTYAWRGQEFTLDDFCGERIRIEWRVSREASGVDTGSLLGWLLDNIEVRGEPACPSDLNGDGSVNASDLALMLSFWGACPACPGECPSDLNRDGVVDSWDQATLLGAWGACPGTSSFGGGTGLPPVVELYSFESVEDYIQWLNSLNQETLLAHILEVLNWLLGNN